MAIKVVTLNAEYNGFSLSWETTNKKNRKHLMRHFLEISNFKEIMDIAESMGWDWEESDHISKRRQSALDYLVASIESSQAQDCECEIPVAELPYKYRNLVHETERSTDPFPSKR